MRPAKRGREEAGPQGLKNYMSDGVEVGFSSQYITKGRRTFFFFNQKGSWIMESPGLGVRKCGFQIQFCY